MADGTEVFNIHGTLTLNDGEYKAKLAENRAATQAAGKEAQSSGGLFGGALKVGLLAAGAAAVAGGVMAVKSFNDWSRETNQLNAVLASTGHEAGVTSKQAIDLAQSIQRTTPVSDEAALAAENMMLTFTNVKSDAFEPASRAAIDMATAMNHGLVPSEQQAADSAKLLGKALQDPDAGLGALHRVGVNVDELKKKFTASMPIQEKQKLIIQEIGNEFGGSAAAQANTFSGKLTMLKNNFEDLIKPVGKLLIDALNPMVSFMNQIVEKISNFHGASGLLSAAIGAVAAFGEKAWNAIKPLIPALGSALLAAFHAVANAAMTLWNALKPALPTLEKIALTMGVLLVGAIIILARTLSIVLPIVAAVLGVLIRVAGFILGVLVGAIEKIIAVVTFVVEGWIKAFQKVWSFISPIINLIATLISIQFNFIVSVITGAMNLIWGIITTIWGAIWGFIGPTVMMIWNFVSNAFMGMVNAVTSTVTGIYNAIVNIFNSVIGFLASLGGRMFDFGRNIIQGMVNGIASMGGAIIDAVKNAAGKLWGVVSKVLGVSSPSTIAYWYGTQIMQGLANGILESTGIVASAFNVSMPNALPAMFNGATGGVQGGSASLVQNFYPQRMSQADMDMAAADARRTIGMKLRGGTT